MRVMKALSREYSLSSCLRLDRAGARTRARHRLRRARTHLVIVGVFSGTYRPAVARASRQVRHTPCTRLPVACSPAPGALSLARITGGSHHGTWSCTAVPETTVRCSPGGTMIASPCRPGPCRGYLSTCGLAARWTSWASVSLHDLFRGAPSCGR